jgi:hypothetical protein
VKGRLEDGDRALAHRAVAHRAARVPLSAGGRSGEGGIQRRPRTPLLDGYARGLKLYRVQRFAEARLEFESVRERFPHDGPSRLLAARCERMASDPPGDRWDGVFRMERK